MPSMSQCDHILIVDDDPGIRELLRDYLEKNGFRASAVADGRGMREALARNRVDLLILDLMLPGEDGLALCRDLRAQSSLPVLMLTARGEDVDRILGLEMGADDYLAKPFNPRELLARIKSILRRVRSLPTHAPIENAKRLHFADWTLDVHARHLLSPEGVVIALSNVEYRLLMVFLSHPRRTLNRDQILDLARGRDALPFDRSVDIQVSRLRRRLGEDAREPVLLKTVRGEGYILAASVEAEP